MFQASFLNKKINIGGKRVNLSIWDTAGQEKFHALGPIYYRMSNGAILVYDITDEDSFQKVCCKKTKGKNSRQEQYLIILI
jgi:Ras-related protein Rab-21